MRRAPDPPDSLTAVDPREWTRAWLRVIASPSVKCVGFAVCSFADYGSGAAIRPGIALLRQVCGGMGNKTVIESLAQIRDWGFIWRYSEGSKNGRAAKADIYRLTYPADTSAIPMLSPDWLPPVENPPEQVSSGHLFLLDRPVYHVS